MKNTKQKSLKDFAKKSLTKKSLKTIKGGTDGSGVTTGTTDTIVTEDIMV